MGILVVILPAIGTTRPCAPFLTTT